jgi:hypothetical protein
LPNAVWDGRLGRVAFELVGNNKVLSLYLVVRHPQNPHQTFENRWEDDELLTSIQTTLEIANRCIEASAQNQWV